MKSLIPIMPIVPSKPCVFGEVSFHLTNCPTDLRLFLGEVVKLMADPAQEHNLKALKQGTLVIGFGAKGALMLYSNPPAHIKGSPARN